jgi:hypothetical protein
MYLLLIGYFLLPVSVLNEPSEEILLRAKSDVFIDVLKDEMLENPTRDVQPLLCIVRLKDGEEFDENVKEAYSYETIGGNNSREALQQLLAENPELKRKKTYSHRLCSVYTKMPQALALRLASKHNRASGITHDMCTWDKVSQLAIFHNPLTLVPTLFLRFTSAEKFYLSYRLYHLIQKFQARSLLLGKKLAHQFCPKR